MNAAWVVMTGMDSEGGMVHALTTTAEAGMAIADNVARRPLEWEQVPAAMLEEGSTEGWTARTGSASWADVIRWKVGPA